MKMEEFKEIIDNFVDKWGDKTEPFRNDFSMKKLNQIESKLNIEFPEAYKYLLENYHNYYYPRILDNISDKGIEAFDLRDLVKIGEMVELTIAYEKAGMPLGFIGFASDSMGNMFCFSKEELQSNERESKVYVFDHDYAKMKELAISFIEWIQRLATI